MISLSLGALRRPLNVSRMSRRQTVRSIPNAVNKMQSSFSLPNAATPTCDSGLSVAHVMEQADVPHHAAERHAARPPGSRLILEDVRSQAAKLGMTIQPIEFKDRPCSMQH